MVASAIAKKMLKKNATGKISSTATEAGDKPLSLSAYRSMTDKERATTKLNARRANNMGEITDKEYDTIVNRIDAANAAESQKMTTKMQQGAADKRAAKPTLSEMSEGTPDSSYNKGGMAKKNKAKSNYAYGGMTTSKPRTGNTDYRKGGMFMKKGKK